MLLEAQIRIVHLVSYLCAWLGDDLLAIWLMGRWDAVTDRSVVFAAKIPKDEDEQAQGPEGEPYGAWDVVEVVSKPAVGWPRLHDRRAGERRKPLQLLARPAEPVLDQGFASH